jgi:hypothetical protein
LRRSELQLRQGLPESVVNRFCGMGTSREEDVPIILDADDDIGSEAWEGYFITAKDNLLPDALHEIYNLYQPKCVPEEWHQTFESNKKLGNKVKFESAYADWAGDFKQCCS